MVGGGACGASAASASGGAGALGGAVCGVFAAVLLGGAGLGGRLDVRLGAQPDGLDAIDTNEGAEFAEFLRCVEGEGDSFPAHAGGAACSMGVGFGVGGEVVVDDVGGVAEI